MVKTYIAHHGILGMKWGKKNGPPYPLSGSAHSSAEKKAGTKGWSKNAKKEMSNEDLRKAINRKNLENQYHRLASQTGKKGVANDALEVSKKALRTTGNVANTVSKVNDFKGYEKREAIDDNDNLSKKEKKAQKKALQETKNSAKANIVGQSANLVSNKTPVIKDKTKLDGMSDAELRKSIERMALETQYDSLYNTKRGKETVLKVLDTAGDVAATAGSIVSIALAIKILMK